MNQGYLSQYFDQVAIKRLSAVEVDIAISHQHEFNGSRVLKELLGTGSGEKIQFPTIFLWLGKENEALSSEGFVTWYDARISHPTRSEYRLYFPTTDVSEMAKAGDLMLIAKRTNGSLMIIIAATGTSIESQLLWLFKISVQSEFEFTLQDIRKDDDKEVDFAVRFILDELGIDIEEPESDYLDSVLAKFGGILPTTKEFSLLTRQTLKDVNALDDPDATLMAWMNYEEKLFRRMERHDVEKRLKTGFVSDAGTDVDGFLKFSLSVQNRRKSRAGLALENHLEAIFQIHKIRYSRVAETENRAKPDFLFPGPEEYHDSSFDSHLLTMLGVKTTCKDRWRQVLSEASRIPNKHLLTLEPGISQNQTDEMSAQNLQLVLPSAIHETYSKMQKSWLLDLKDFVKIVVSRQLK
jgi:EcoRII C terminal